MTFSRGFTLVELITTMIILSILAAIAIPKFSGHHGFESRGFSDQLLTVLQDARRLAVAQHRLACVVASGSAVSVTQATLSAATTCTVAANNPNAAGAYSLPIPAGVVLAGGPVNFDALGRPSGGTTFSISSSDGNFTLTVEGETGYVHY